MSLPQQQNFYAKSKSWSLNDTTTEEVRKQLISAPKHILRHSSSCIDLIFDNQPNLLIDSGIHHQVIFCKLNLEIEYSPPYAREVWTYRKAQTDLVNNVIDKFNWVNLFLDKNINKQIILFNRTISNIFHNFIPNKIFFCDKRDPPWLNDWIKYIIKKKKTIFQK